MADTSIPTPEQLLRRVGLRVTRPRLAVLGALEKAPHSGADAVIAACRHDVTERPISTQAVYDVLNVLTELGVVRRIQPTGSVARYELHTGDNHHHVVCRRCGVVSDVECATGEAPCLETTHDRGFAIDEAEVTYWGLCPDCQQNHPTARIQQHHEGAHHA